jgi:integrase
MLPTVVTDHRLFHRVGTSLTTRLVAGVPAKVVSERLGHANIGITMDTYSHVRPALDVEAAELVAGLIFGDEEVSEDEP